jgi:hypothetical protein
VSEHPITPPTPEMTRSLSYARKQITRKNEQKDADDLNKQEILEWIGVGPHVEGHWRLTDVQLAQFEQQKGRVDSVPEGRITQWEIAESGYIRWKTIVRS